MMEKENLDIYNLVENELIREGIWFTQKSDPTYQNAKSYYKLDKYGDPEEKTKNQIAKEVKSLIGDGASDIPEAIELWKNDQMIEARLDFKSNLVTTFEPKPVVDNIEAYENPVQFPQSKKTEAKTKKTEGAGAGYEIRGTVLSAKVNNFEIIGNTTNQYNEKMYELKCDIDVKLEDVQFESYDYGGKIDFPIDGKVTYLIVSENGNNDVEGDLTNSDIESALDGAKIKEMLGGGWVHETFTGEFSGEFDGDLYGDYYALDYEMVLTQDTVVDFIDKKVDGVMDEVTYCVYDKEGDPVDDFTDKDEAIEYAKKNDCIEVIEKYHDYELVDADGSVDDNSYEDGDIVWEREYTKQYKFDSEVEESKKVKTEASDYVSKYDELDDLLDEYVSSNEEKLKLYNYFNDTELDNLDTFENEAKYDDWLFDAVKKDYNKLRAYLDEKAEDTDILMDKITDNKKMKKEDYDYDAYMKEQEELKKQYKDRIMKSATPEIINAFNDLNDLLNNGGNVIALDGFYFPEKAITVVELADKNYHLNPSMDLTTSNILNMVGNNDTFEQAIDELFADYDANSAYSWADNFVTVLSKLDFDIQDADDEEFEECKKVENFVNDDGIEIVDDKESGFTYAKIFVDFFVADKDNAEEEVNKFLDKYTTELGGRTETLKSMLEYLDNWNYHTYVDILEKKLKDSELLECNVNFNKHTKEVVNENYQKRLQEVNNKSANLIADAMQADGFDAESDAGKILVRTQQLFTALSDKGLDVDVTLDNGESTSVIQLGTAGGKIVITITNTDKPLQAFISGNVEINDDILKEFQQVKDCIKTV